MKLILRSLTVIAIFLVPSRVIRAQCTVSNIIIQNTSLAGSPAPGTCTVTFDASFTIENNNGNKYIFIHAWLASDYPNYFHCVDGQSTLNGSIAAPDAGDLGNEFLTIGINNDVLPPTLLTEYTPDPTVPITTVSSIERTVNPDGSATFILHGITTTLPISCGTPTVVIADVWSSQSAAAQRAHCVNCGIRFGAGFLRVTGFVNCAALQFNASITKNVPETVSGVYRIYVDVNGDGYFSPGVDTLLRDATSFNITGGVGASVGVSGPIPSANLNQDLFIVVTQTSGAASGASTVTLLLSTQCAPLPVTFRTFTADRYSRTSVALKWETATESNNSGFALQRNIGKDWELVTFIPTQAVGGNSSSVLTYNYMDRNEYAGMSLYRIKQVDFDNKSRLSEVRAVRGEGQEVKMTVYPNPSTDGTINIVLEDRMGTRDLSLVDMNGRIVRQWLGVTTNAVQAVNLRPGIYTIRVMVRGTGAQSVEKIIVSK